MNYWIQTYSGKKFDFEHFNSANIDLIDIAHALSCINRFTGHTREPYSVAQHSVLVSEEVKRLGGDIDVQIYGLFHDAAEAYIGDISRPMKQFMKEYTGGVLKTVEKNIQIIICQALALVYNPLNVPIEVKKADDTLLAIERRDLLPENIEWGIELPDISNNQLEIKKIWNWETAKVNFLKHYENLCILKRNATKQKSSNVSESAKCIEDPRRTRIN